MGIVVSSCCNLDSSQGSSQMQYEVNLNAKAAENYRRIISFKDFKGFKRIENISEYYELFNTLGSGSFGEVVRAEHKKASVECAIKIIKKRKIQEHQILIDLMHNELKVLEETVTYCTIIRL